MEQDLAMHKLRKALAMLPPSAHVELIDFVNYLQFKYQTNGAPLTHADLAVTEEGNGRSASTASSPKTA